MVKKLISIIAVVAVIGLIIWGIWIFGFAKSSNSNSSPNLAGSLPPIQSQTQSGTSVHIQSIANSQNPEVAKDFLSGIENSNQIALGGTVIASSYALQIWGDNNKGGEALLENTSSTGWTLISLGGGEWTVVALIQEGVPVADAELLVAGVNTGISTSATSSINIPSGNTITIGTSKGSVTMSNFYKNPLYLAQEQQQVVIQQTSTYNIIYNISYSSFTITINTSSFEAVRPIAEAGFLNSLNILQEDACKLSVYENISGVASSQYTGQSFPLSFCGVSATSQ